ncbi:MAG: DUF885 domain-containing protein [Verrucomicrobiota bacterium]|nr:DUF885 domain-containing protein [Verrucomicrobiota bacterium]
MSPAVRQFRRLADHYLEEHWKLFPQEASEHGLHAFDDQLGENDADTWQRSIRLMGETLAAVEALPDSAFAADDWLDRRGFLALLRSELFFTDRFPRWRMNPQAHVDVALESILLLLIRNADRLERVRPAVERRLAQLPRFLAQGAACLRAPVPIWTRLARKTCAGAESFLNDVAVQLAPISREPETTRRLARDAIAAFAQFAETAARHDPSPANAYAIGRQQFEMLIRERTGLPYSLPEVQALGEDLVHRLRAELDGEARKFGRKKASQILEAAAERWAEEQTKTARGSLLDQYRRLTVHVRERFERAEVVTFPKGEHCRVLLVPVFLRHHFPTAAYLSPGAFDRDQTGIFWVNDLSLEHTNPAQKAAEIRQHFGLEFTCAHEAYPGHHLQFAIQNRHPSKLRRLFHHAIFYEGWTLWCEKLSVEQRVIDFPEARLIQLHDALWRAHRIVIDCGLHEGSLSYAAACRRLREGVGFTAARARGDVNWYTSSPTVPMSYLLGRLEVERLHAHCVTQEGWSLRRFHDWLLSFGAIPWSWIWQCGLRPKL